MPPRLILHSALILQEGIAAGLDANTNVYVAYFDAAKAFDSVWIDVLFYQLRNMGVVGKTWQPLYKSYHDFKCMVRLAGCYADWYQMRCGIHQGGFLSILKYAAFINPLLREIENSGFCHIITYLKRKKKLRQWKRRRLTLNGKISVF